MSKVSSFKTIKTPINGLKIHLNKVVGDDRGFFCDLAEADNPIWKTRIKHLHASIAVNKGVARGGHYHLRLTENFYMLSGTSLMLFHDFRTKSKTFGKTWSVILGFSPYVTESDPVKLPLGTKSYFIDENKLAQIEIAPYIYHAFWPLTNERVVAMATGTTGYDPTDFVKPSIEEMPRALKVLKKFGIRI